MATDYGQGVNLSTDLPSGRWSYATGLRNLSNAVYRRVSTPRGSLARHPDYGLDIRDLLGESITALALRTAEQQFAREVEKDERIERCVCTFMFSTITSVLTARFDLSTADGPFSLVLAVSEITVAIVESP